MTRRQTRRQFLNRTALWSAGTVLSSFSAHSAGSGIDASRTVECAAQRAPMRHVEGKVAVITGGTSGIGLGAARAFVAAGMKVVITGLRREGIDNALAGFARAGHSDQVHAIRVDVADRQGMESAALEAVRLFGKIHALINNAGVTLPATLGATSYKDWDWLLSVNLTGAFNGIHAFLPHIQAHGEGGQIVSTSSIMGLFATGAGQGAYTVSKFAMVGMMEALRAELIATNVGVSVFCPGIVNTHLGETSRAHYPGNPRDAGFTEGPPAAANKAEKATSDPIAMDPQEAGRLLLRGIRNNDLYILSHPEFAQNIAQRNGALIAAIPKDVESTAQRRELARSLADQSIYAAGQKSC